MKLELDENIGVRGRDRLARAGHDVTTVHSQRLGGATDIALARACAGEARALVTLDLDFANPMRFPPETHAGIAVLRLPRAASPDDLSEVLDSLVKALETRVLEGQLWIVERHRIREYDRGGSGLD